MQPFTFVFIFQDEFNERYLSVSAELISQDSREIWGAESDGGDVDKAVPAGCSTLVCPGIPVLSLSLHMQMEKRWATEIVESHSVNATYKYFHIFIYWQLKVFLISIHFIQNKFVFNKINYFLCREIFILRKETLFLYLIEFRFHIGKSCCYRIKTAAGVEKQYFIFWNNIPFSLM